MVVLTTQPKITWTLTTTVREWERAPLHRADWTTLHHTTLHRIASERKRRATQRRGRKCAFLFQSLASIIGILSPPTSSTCNIMTASDGASSISVTVRVRPFTIREAAQLTKCDDGPLFLGDGSLAAVPTPKLSQKGIRPVIKVVDDKAL